MAGLRVEPLVTERLATMARAQGARTVGGRIPADPRPPRETAHIPGRVLRPQLPAGGPYIPVFSVPGQVLSMFYPTSLDNVTGGPLTIESVAARVDSPPSGSAFSVTLTLDAAFVVTWQIPVGGVFAQVPVGVTWPAGFYLNVLVQNAAGTADLVVSVVTA